MKTGARRAGLAGEGGHSHLNSSRSEAHVLCGSCSQGTHKWCKQAARSPIQKASQWDEHSLAPSGSGHTRHSPHRALPRLM